MRDLWTEELTEAEADELIAKMAGEIRRRRLEVPAVLFLEMHKPLSYVGSQAAIAFAPFLVPILGFERVNDYSRLFAKREYVERLLCAIEAKDEPPARKEASRSVANLEV